MKGHRLVGSRQGNKHHTQTQHTRYVDVSREVHRVYHLLEWSVFIFLLRICLLLALSRVLQAPCCTYAPCSLFFRRSVTALACSDIASLVATTGSYHITTQASQWADILRETTSSSKFEHRTLLREFHDAMEIMNVFEML